jgi:hypothetical protein
MHVWRILTEDEIRYLASTVKTFDLHETYFSQATVLSAEDFALFCNLERISFLELNNVTELTLDGLEKLTDVQFHHGGQIRIKDCPELLTLKVNTPSNTLQFISMTDAPKFRTGTIGRQRDYPCENSLLVTLTNVSNNAMGSPAFDIYYREFHPKIDTSPSQATIGTLAATGNNRYESSIRKRGLLRKQVPYHRQTGACRPGPRWSRHGRRSQWARGRN